MELRDYLKIIKRHYRLVFIITIVVALSTLIFTLASPVVYDTSLSLFITRATSQATKDYKYDGYYAIKSAELFSDNIEQWLASPEVVVEIYEQAEVNLVFRSLRNLRKKFKAYKMSPQYVEVRFKAREKEEAQKISRALPEVLQGKTHELAGAVKDISFNIKGATPVIVTNIPKPLLNSLIGLVSGFVLGIFVVFFREYLRED